MHSRGINNAIYYDMQPDRVFYIIDNLDFEAFQKYADEVQISDIKHPYTGGSVLHCAILSGAFEIAEYIIANDFASIYGIDGFGRSPLQAAKLMGANSIYDLILQKSLLGERHPNNPDGFDLT